MIRINAIFEQSFLQLLTRAAKEEHVSRSELIRKAVTDYLTRREAAQQHAKRKTTMDQAFMVQDALRAKAGDWDGVATIRRWRDQA